ncbi:MAG: cytochrome c biogenesis protein ResB [Verrucomicrobia bacterium]|nr:cytochrome c biogenesis protein ResB [Verrucomicrobiota bacterium]
MMDRIWAFLTSLRLTVVLLAFSILLVFVGTVAQADEGLYQAQERYFKHWIVWGFSFFGHKVPLPLPGGYLLGMMLLANLVAGHIKRFEWSWRKLGIHLTHVGIILLLVGQLTTDLFSRETQMRFAEGETRHYSESAMNHELVFIADADADTQELVAVPARLLARGGELRHERLPFTIRVKSWWPNSEPAFRPPMQQNGPPLAPNGIGRHFDFKQTPETRKMEDRNIPTAVIEIVPPKGPPGAWVVSAWAGDETLVAAVRASYSRQAGPEMGNQIGDRLIEPQTVEANGRKWSFTLRPARVYNPFSITLLKTTHKVYPGTDIPKDFRSRVRIENPQTGENREVEVFMNSPLRYGGLTFYQYQMGRDELDANRGTSTLQVVRNPSWLTPYAGCIIVGVGLLVQFMIHLVGFVSRKRAV